MRGDTSLIRMVISDISKNKGWTYEETLEKFYHSQVCKGISDRRTGMFTFAHIEIEELFDEELNGVDIFRSGIIR